MLYTNPFPEVYKYKAEDITIMIDSDDQEPHLRPTQDNIVRDSYDTLQSCSTVRNKQITEISKLVKKSRAGDKFYFHCEQFRIDDETQ